MLKWVMYVYMCVRVCSGWHAVVVDLPFPHDATKWPIEPNTRIGNILTGPGAYLDNYLVLHGPFSLLDLTKAPRWDEVVATSTPVADLWPMTLHSFGPSHVIFPDGIVAGLTLGYQEVCLDRLTGDKLSLDPQAMATQDLHLCYGFPCDFVPMWSPPLQVLYPHPPGQVAGEIENVAGHEGQSPVPAPAAAQNTVVR